MVCRMLSRQLGGDWDFMDIEVGSWRAEFRVYDAAGSNARPAVVMDVIEMNAYVTDIVQFGDEFVVTINAPYT